MPQMSDTLLYPELSYEVCGLCFQVHNDLGRYRSEKQYADLLEAKFKETGIGYKREDFLPPSFPGEGKRNKPDFLVEDKIILDLKAKNLVNKEDFFQMKRYLDSTGKELGLIVNFRQLYLRPKRVIRGTH